MSILKSNNANFEITLDWLRKRGYNFYSYSPTRERIKEGDPNYVGPYYAAKSDGFFERRKRIVLEIDREGALCCMHFHIFIDTKEIYLSHAIDPWDYEGFFKMEKMIENDEIFVFQ